MFLCSDALMWLMEEKALPEEHKDTLQKVVSSIGECNKAIRSFLDTGARVGLQDTSVLLRAVVSNIRVCKSCLLSDSWLLAVGPDHCKQAG